MPTAHSYTTSIHNILHCLDTIHNATVAQADRLIKIRLPMQQHWLPNKTHRKSANRNIQCKHINHWSQTVAQLPTAESDRAWVGREWLCDHKCDEIIYLLAMLYCCWRSEMKSSADVPHCGAKVVPIWMARRTAKTGHFWPCQLGTWRRKTHPWKDYHFCQYPKVTWKNMTVRQADHDLLLGVLVRLEKPTKCGTKAADVLDKFSSRQT